MQRRDLLKDQIEQAGKVLALALSKFLRQKSAGITTASTAFENDLQDELAIDFNYLKTLDEPELTAYLATFHLTEEHLEKLALYCYEIAIESDDKKEASMLLTKAHDLLSIEMASENTFIFHSEPSPIDELMIIDRFELSNKIKQALKNL